MPFQDLLVCVSVVKHYTLINLKSLVKIVKFKKITKFTTITTQNMNSSVAVEEVELVVKNKPR